MFAEKFELISYLAAPGIWEIAIVAGLGLCAVGTVAGGAILGFVLMKRNK